MKNHELAFANDQLRFVTALGTTNTANGWKTDKSRGGVLLDIASGEVVAHGLCMQHSPRCWRGQTFALNSGEGQLCAVDTKTGKLDVIAALPGYARGLVFAGRHAFVGLSRIREEHVFGGLPIAERHDENQRHCGIQVVDMQTGTIEGFLRLTIGRPKAPRSAGPHGSGSPGGLRGRIPAPSQECSWHRRQRHDRSPPRRDRRGRRCRRLDARCLAVVARRHRTA